MDKTPVFWTTKDGRKMNVDDMDDNHVRNAFKMLLRKIDAMEKKIAKTKEQNFFTLHGEMAIASIEDQVNDDLMDETDEYLGLCMKFHGVYEDGPGEIGYNAGEFYKD